MKTFVGIDYHKRFSYATIINERGDVLKQGRFNNSLEDARRFLDRHAGQECRAVLEATRNWCVMHDWLEDLVGEVTLAHPKKVKAIAEAKVKTDKIDAATLAQLLRCDLVPPAHVCSPQTRALKNLLRHRAYMVRARSSIKNRIHVLIDRHPHVRAQWKAEELFSGRGVRWLRSVELPKDEKRILDAELDTLVHLENQIAQADRWLREVGRKDERVRRLMTIPGIGRTLSLLILIEIDDINRFRTPKKLHAYAGLIPSTHASGGKTYHGRLVKEGNKWLRWAMVEAVHPAMRKDPHLALFHRERSSRIHPNKATIATARRLLTIVYRVLKENRDDRHDA